MTDLLERTRRGQPLADYEIIDIHCHLGRADFAIPELSAESLVRAMDRLGVKTCLCSHVRCLTNRIRSGNDDLLAAMRTHPGRILGYVILWPGNREAVEAEVGRCLDAGFTGIKLHSANGFAYDDEAYWPAYEIAHERRLPMLFHTWGGAEEFKQIGRMARRCPNVPMILAHTGSTTEEAYVTFARENANVYLDLCLSKCPRGLVERLVAQLPAERIVWGSDALFINMAQQLGKVVGADIPEDAKKMILSGNAKHILSHIEKP